VTPQDARIAICILLAEQAAAKLTGDQENFLIARDHFAKELREPSERAQSLRCNALSGKLGGVSVLVSQALSRKDLRNYLSLSKMRSYKLDVKACCLRMVARPFPNH